jgi:hypothetical protein
MDARRHPPQPISAAGIRVVPMAEWDSVMLALDGLDTYTGLHYHQLSALLETPGTQPTLVHYAGLYGEMALPLLLRPLPERNGWDASSAYGYGGPVGSGEVREAFGAALTGWAWANSVVATFLRLHPLLDNARLVPSSAELVELGPTVGWDVGRGRDLRAAMHRHHRRLVRKADEAGLQIDIVQRPASLDEFRGLYRMTMQRRRADAFYSFGPAYWKALVAEEGRGDLVLVEGRVEGRLVAALLCFVHRPWLHYHLGASDDDARSIGASHRCFLAAAQWAQAQGLSCFHLGGGVGSGTDSPLLTFKHRFDPATALLRFHIAKFVHDPDRYAALAGTSSTAGFFPRWRDARVPA